MSSRVIKQKIALTADNLAIIGALDDFYEWRQSTTFISVRWAWVNAALLLLLILNVFFYHCQAVFTYRCNEVAV